MINEELQSKLDALENQIRTRFVNTEFENMEDLYLNNPFFLSNYDALQIKEIYKMDSTYRNNTDYWNEIGQL